MTLIELPQDRRHAIFGYNKSVVKILPRYRFMSDNLNRRSWPVLIKQPFKFPYALSDASSSVFPTNRSKSVYSLDSTVAHETRSWRRLIHFSPELEIEIGPNRGAPVNRKYLCGDRARGTKTISAYVNHFYGAKSGYPV